MACEARPDGMREGQGRGGGTGGRGNRIGITNIGSRGVEGGGKRHIPPISSALQGAWIICVSAEKK